MCQNIYADAVCAVCTIVRVRVWRETVYCDRNPSGGMCPQALQQFHNGPTHVALCSTCKALVHVVGQGGRDLHHPRRELVVEGASQHASAAQTQAWARSNEARRAQTGPAAAANAYATQARGDLMLGQAFDPNSDLRTSTRGIAPPDGSVIHTSHPRFSRGYHDPNRAAAGVTGADFDPAYPGSETYGSDQPYTLAGESQTGRTARLRQAINGTLDYTDADILAELPPTTDYYNPATDPNVTHRPRNPPRHGGIPPVDFVNDAPLVLPAMRTASGDHAAGRAVQTPEPITQQRRDQFDDRRDRDRRARRSDGPEPETPERRRRRDTDRPHRESGRESGRSGRSDRSDRSGRDANRSEGSSRH